MPGINGDLITPRYYDSTTPVIYTESNKPIEDVETNVELLDQKLEGWIQSGTQAFSDSGDGSNTVSVTFTTVMNATPRIVATPYDVSSGATGALTIEISNRNTTGFDLTVIADGTTGAWTGFVSWLADGR